MEAGTGVITLDKLLTVEEVSEVLGLSEDATRRYVRTGRIPAVHVGRQIRFNKREIDKWLRDGGSRMWDRTR